MLVGCTPGRRMLSAHKTGELVSAPATPDIRILVPHSHGMHTPRQSWLYGMAIFLLLSTVYLANGDFLFGNDAKANVYVSISILREGNVSFTPREAPHMFAWRIRKTGHDNLVKINHWSDRIDGQKASVLLSQGALQAVRPFYYVSPSTRRGIYVNTFGPGTGIAAAPFFALLTPFAHDWPDNNTLIWYGNKCIASFFIAFSAVWIFFAASQYIEATNAAVIALLYGLATCVWSIDSQALWQHTPNACLLSMGIYCFTRSRENRHACFSGFLFALAVACRPTSVVVVIVCGMYLWMNMRRRLLPYLAGAIPPAILLASYNAHYLGAPWHFGQLDRGHAVALAKTGSEALWQTPLWEGVMGLLVSPSRGLFMYSPVLLFALIGMTRAWKQHDYAFLKPLCISSAVLLLIAAKWFDWWGGWTFGYRPIVDTMPLLVLMLIPAMDWIRRTKSRLCLFVAAMIWSIGVQMVGAYAYHMNGWNDKIAGYKIIIPDQPSPQFAWTRLEAEKTASQWRGARIQAVRQNIDIPINRHRLWSIADNQIFYYLSRFSESRQTKKNMMQYWLDHPAT